MFQTFTTSQNILEKSTSISESTYNNDETNVTLSDSHNVTDVSDAESYASLILSSEQGNQASDSRSSGNTQSKVLYLPETLKCETKVLNENHKTPGGSKTVDTKYMKKVCTSDVEGDIIIGYTCYQ